MKVRQTCGGRSKRRRFVDTGRGFFDCFVVLLLLLLFLFAQAAAEAKKAKDEKPQQDVDDDECVVEHAGETVCRGLQEQQSEGSKQPPPLWDIFFNNNNNNETTVVDDLISNLMNIFSAPAGAPEKEETADKDEKETGDKSTKTGPINFPWPPKLPEKPPLEKWKNQSEAFMADLLTNLTTSSSQTHSFWDTIRLFHEALLEVLQQIKDTFAKELEEHCFSVLQLWYFLQHEEEIKNSVWKRRQHRFLTPLSVSTAVSLQDAMYLSHLAYGPDCQMIRHALTNIFRPGQWQLRNCTTTSVPNQPAHFVAVFNHEQHSRFHMSGLLGSDEEEVNPLLSFLQNVLLKPFEKSSQKANSNNSSAALDVVLVIRGTKEQGDILSDGMLRPANYTPGQHLNSTMYTEETASGQYKAHDGILRSAFWIVEQYKQDFRNLLQQYPDKQKLNLFLFGHSLGAGTAALAAMEFHAQVIEPFEQELKRKQQSSSSSTSSKDPPKSWLSVRSIGFGTPALVSPELSSMYKDRITTVVTDADVVPRMSGNLLLNAWNRVVGYNWTASALADFDMLLEHLITDAQFPFQRDFLINFGKGVRQFLEASFDDCYYGKLKIEKAEGKSGDRHLPPELIPPGECIHLYRDGTAWQGVYTNCNSFSEIELVHHLIDDHLIPSGYYNGLLNFVREQEKNVSWHFDHDLLELPI